MFNTYKNYYKKFFSFTLSFFIILSTGKKVTKAETFDLSGSSENKNYDQPIYINWDKQFNDMFIPIDTKSFFLKFRSSSWIENCKDHNLNVEQSKKNAGDITHNLNLSIKYAHEVINRIDHFYKDTSEKAKKYSESTWFVESEFEKLNEKFKKIKKDLINKKKNIPSHMDINKSDCISSKNDISEDLNKLNLEIEKLRRQIDRSLLYIKECDDYNRDDDDTEKSLTDSKLFNIYLFVMFLLNPGKSVISYIAALWYYLSPWPGRICNSIYSLFLSLEKQIYLMSKKNLDLKLFSILEYAEKLNDFIYKENIDPIKEKFLVKIVDIVKDLKFRKKYMKKKVSEHYFSSNSNANDILSNFVKYLEKLSSESKNKIESTIDRLRNIQHLQIYKDDNLDKKKKELAKFNNEIHNIQVEIDKNVNILNNIDIDIKNFKIPEQLDRRDEEQLFYEIDEELNYLDEVEKKIETLTNEINEKFNEVSFLNILKNHKDGTIIHVSEGKLKKI